MAEGFDAGAIIAKLELQKQQWDASIRAIQTDMAEVGKAVGQKMQQISTDWASMAKKTSLAVGVVAGALFGLVKKTADYGDELWKTSQKTGIAVETLSGLKLAADKSDMSIGDLAMGMSRLARLVVEANQGGKEQAAVLDRLGIKATDVSGKIKPMDTLMGEVADKFAVMPDSTEKTALAIDLFGKSGMDMIPLLNMGSEGLKKEREEAERLGLVMSGQTAKSSEAFNDQLTTLKKSALGLTLVIGQELLPVFKKIVEGIIEIVSGFRKFLASNPEIVQAIKNIVESIRWLVVAVKDAITWVGNLGSKLSGTAAVWSAVIQRQIELEMAASKNRSQQFDRRLLEDKKTVNSAESTTGTIIQLSDAVVGANRSAIDAIKRSTLDEYHYKLWAINSKYNAQHEALVKEKADAASLALNERARQAEITAVHRNENEKRIAFLNKATATIMSLQEKQRDKEKANITKSSIQYSKFFSSVANQWQSIMRIMVFRATGMWLELGSGVEKGTQTFKEKFKTTAEKVNQFVQIMQQSFGQFFQALTQLSNQRFQRDLQNLDAKYEKEKLAIENSLMSEDEKNAALEALEEKHNAEERALKEKQLAAEKKANIIQAVMNMAAAITSSFATFGWPFGLIAAALAAAACAVQIKAIKAQEIALAEGGYADRPTHALIGEAGPEVVTPLDKFQDMMGLGKRGRKRGEAPMFGSLQIQAWDGRDVERVFNRRIVPLIRKATMRESLILNPAAVR